MQNRTKTTSGPVQDISGKVKAGKTYELEGYIFYRNENGKPTPPDSAVFNITLLCGTGEKREVMVSQSVEKGSWGRIHGTFTVPEDAKVRKASILIETEYKEEPTDDDLMVFFVDDFSMKLVELSENVQNVIDKLQSLPAADEITLSDKTSVTEAREAYTALTDDEREKVSANLLAKLDAAEQKIAQLEADEQEKDKQDQEKADAVSTQIKALPEADAVTLEDETKIREARKSYEALTEAQKAKVGDAEKAKLKAAEDKLAELKAEKEEDEKDQAKADAVSTQIKALPEAAAVTLEDETKIQEARKSYEALTEAQKAKVGDAEKAKLKAAEDKLAELKAEKEEDEKDQAKADAVSTQIKALPEADAVTLEDETKIREARENYEALTEAQKAKVGDAEKAKLKAVEDKIAELKAEQEEDEKEKEEEQRLKEQAKTVLSSTVTTVKAEVAALKETDYTPESWKALQDALSAAETLMAKADVTTAELTAANAKITEARRGLKKAEIPHKEEEIKVNKISITPARSMIAAGKKVNLNVTVLPENAKDTTVSFSSSNPKYATVSSSGVVVTKKAGAGKTVTITATAADGSVKATAKVKIMKHAVKKITLKAKSKTVKAGKKLSVKSLVKTTGKKVNKKLEWTSSNAKYATVNSKGVVTTKKAGKGKSVTITARSTDGTNKKATLKIKIK
ncbi:MAG: Ig-like domain-containing protein [Lachnospiraceae bacterium]